MRILERGYRSAFGEIDLVAQDGATIVFVEVKARSRGGFSPAEEAVGPRKQGRLVRTACHYLQARRLSGVPVRFDVVAIQAGSLRHLRGAFEAAGWTL
jgi:putative endonuclease